MKTGNEIMKYVSERTHETAKMLSYAILNRPEHVAIIQARLRTLTEILEYAFLDNAEINNKFPAP